ncbi:Hypothetical predicted protein [Cloeon dipterum]|uniref:MARVEL domain-containing protein n=1 Tax=Cloeon dipterum TaxID=197152 RepID=A0A8S1DRT0_9INSE|nr:Hypothetical predicted protein [Cloeon dipterum]
MGSTSGGLWGIHIDIHHFIKTIPGILRLVQFLFGIICIACSAPAQKAGTHWFLFVVVISFLLTFLWIVVYFFTIKDVFKSLPWNMIEMGCHGVLSVLYLTAFITQLSIWSPPVQSGAGANLAAGSFAADKEIRKSRLTRRPSVTSGSLSDSDLKRSFTNLTSGYDDGLVANRRASGGGGIRLSFSKFYTTVAGMLLLVEFVFGIICLACASPAQHPATGWFLFVAAISFIFTILWIINYMFNVMESVSGVNWNTVELVSFAILAVLYFTAATAQLGVWGPASSKLASRSANLAAGSFGVFNTIAYATSAFLAFLETRSTPQV